MRKLASRHEILTPQEHIQDWFVRLAEQRKNSQHDIFNEAVDNFVAPRVLWRFSTIQQRSSTWRIAGVAGGR